MQKMETMEVNNIELGVVPETTVDQDKKYKLVSEPAIARWLLKDGFRVVDIKPKRHKENESIFIFAVEGDFLGKLAKYTTEFKNKKQ